EIMLTGQRITLSGVVVDTSRPHALRADNCQNVTINGGVYRAREATGFTSVMRFRTSGDFTVTGANISGPTATQVGNGVLADNHDGLTVVGNTFADVTNAVRYQNATSN